MNDKQNLCLLCPSPSEAFGPYREDDCLCRKCVEEMEKEEPQERELTEAEIDRLKANPFEMCRTPAAVYRERPGGGDADAGNVGSRLS